MVIQFVKFESGLTESEVRAVMEERAPQYREVPGLLQKYYGRDQETGEFCGIYLLDSQESLHNLRQTELARTIPEAYRVKDTRIEVFDVIFPLYPGHEPVLEN